MDPATADNQSSLFFHLQRSPARHYRRVRKEPEELPQALRYFKYANLNPRIAAFLGKQDPKSLLKRSKTSQGGKREDGKDIGGTAPPAGGLGEFGNDWSQEARRLLPEIGQGMSLMGMGAFGDDPFGQRLSFSNEIDDPQRYQFEETTFAAPNILKELADALTRFSSLYKEYIDRTTLYDPDSGDLLPPERTTPSALLPGFVTNMLCQEWADVVSETVYTQRVWQTAAYKAAYNYNQVTAAVSRKQDEAATTGNNTSGAAPVPHTDKTATGASSTKVELKSIVDLLEEVKAKNISKRDTDFSDARNATGKKKRKASSKDTNHGALAGPGSADQDDGSQVSSDGTWWQQDHGQSSSRTDFRQWTTNSRQQKADSRQTKSNVKFNVGKNRLGKQTSTNVLGGGSNAMSRPQMIGGKLQSIPEEKRKKSVISFQKGKEWSLRSNISVTLLDQVGAAEKRHANHTISFNLMSKKAMEEGWIVSADPEPDMDKDNLLEWAAGRLQAAIKQREAEEEAARKSGNNKPVLVRNYGDSRRDTLLKLYRKGNEVDSKVGAMATGLLAGKKHSGTTIKIPSWSKMESGEKQRLLVQLPDGSMTVYYPNGENVAISASAVPDQPGQLYVNCYDNDDERTCLASFTPYGKSCCYHKNGVPGLVLTDEGGLLKAEDGSLIKKWEWPLEGMKLKDTVVFHLNKEMYVRVTNKNNVMLYYNSSREGIKIPVGAVPGIDKPSALPERSSVLRSGLRFSSKASSELQSAMKGSKDDRAKNKRKFATGKKMAQSGLTRKSCEIDELKQSLEPPSRFEFESQADRELQRLQDKTKHLVEDWMEHYRMAVGISSPALKKLLDKPQVKTGQRKVQSARERKISVPSEFDESSDKYQSFRSPSAPPRHMLPGPHSVILKEDQALKVSPAAKTPGAGRKSMDAHVRIEETPHEVLVPAVHDATLSKTLPSPGTPCSRLRPATHGSRTMIRLDRSTVRLSTSAGHSPCKSAGKRWSPAPENCPVATRSTLLHDDSKQPDKIFACKCNKRSIPLINDVELDYFLRLVAPASQLIVICVVNSLHSNAHQYDKMFDALYKDKNKNRAMRPCAQGRHDIYRILRYDLAVAKLGTSRKTPLLLGRHNVVPGMTLLYCGGKLLFADHIFNGYGNAKNDFRKQLQKSKREAMLGHFLPDDFKFTPGRGKSGLRAAWGGEVGGTGIDGKGSPGLFLRSSSEKMADRRRSAIRVIDETRSEGDVTSEGSISSARMPASRSFDTTHDFVQYTLSTRMYVTPSDRMRSRTAGALGTRQVQPRYSTSATQLSPIGSNLPPAASSQHVTINEDSSLRAAQVKSFLRMQAVK